MARLLALSYRSNRPTQSSIKGARTPLVIDESQAMGYTYLDSLQEQTIYFGGKSGRENKSS